MKINKDIIKVGSRVKLNEEVDMGYCVYSKGHEFNVVSQGERGFNLEDDDGNKIFETRLMYYKLDLI